MASTSSSVDQSNPILKNVIRDTYGIDIEKKALDDAHLMNSTVRNFAWSDVTVTVKDNKSGEQKAILKNVSGFLEAGMSLDNYHNIPKTQLNVVGELCALMGPSGCGKTTLLNVLAHRDAATGGKVEGESRVNGQKPSIGTFRKISTYVEQEDALIGSLTVKETMHFAARLAHKKYVVGQVGSYFTNKFSTLSKDERIRRIDGLLDSFGLRNQANTIIGTPIRKGISGGQKRRVSVASQLLTGPKILFLDEPTSGLDSAASWEVMSFVKEVAKRNNVHRVSSLPCNALLTSHAS
jgi:ABC-type lipoprotein export system ATPase subunit